MTAFRHSSPPLALAGLALLSLMAWTSSCHGEGGPGGPSDSAGRESERLELVREQIIPSGVQDPAVLAAMRQVPRHRFVPAHYSAFAYLDRPLPIGHDQTISQPSLVAKMTEALALKKTDKVLEIGTGSGYQAAILAELVDEVFTIEIVAPLARQAQQTLGELGYRNIHTRIGDGYRGWPDKAPFDAIIVTAAPDHVPQPLLDQLAVGGRLIIPVGRHYQTLELYQRTAQGYEQKTITFVRFVPLVREGQQE